MKRPLLIVLALLLILFSAAVCEASEFESCGCQSSANQMFCSFRDGTFGESARNVNMRFHNFSVEISGDPTRIENMDLHEVDDETAGPFTKIGGTILYNFDW